MADVLVSYDDNEKRYKVVRRVLDLSNNLHVYLTGEGWKEKKSGQDIEYDKSMWWSQEELDSLFKQFKGENNKDEEKKNPES